jgi:hypothetical protein
VVNGEDVRASESRLGLSASGHLGKEFEILELISKFSSNAKTDFAREWSKFSGRITIMEMW